MGWAPQRGDDDPVEHMHTRLANPAVTDTAPTAAGARHTVPRPVAPTRRAMPGSASPDPGPGRPPWRRAVVGGWSFAPGTIAVTGVTFPAALEAADPAGVAIRIVDLVNTAGEPVVLTDPGFAPDGEGFTLAVCAAEPGPFLAEVRYSHVDDGAVPPQPEGGSPG